MTTKKDEAIKIALTELKEQSFARTEQHLENHEVVTEEGKPLITHIESDPANKGFTIFFALKDVKYLLAIPIYEVKERLQLHLAYYQPEIKIRLIIRSETLSAKEITTRLNLTPTETHMKGDRRFKNDRMKKTLKAHLWIYKPKQLYYRDVEAGIEQMLATLQPIQKQFQAIDSQTTKELVIDDKCNADFPFNYHFNSTLLQQMAQLNINLYIYPHPHRPEDNHDLTNPS